MGDRTVNRLTLRTPALAALLVLAGAFPLLRAQQAAPDLLLSNGKIITVDERFSIAQAVAIRGDRIVAVGTNQDLARLAGPEHTTDRPAGKVRHPRPHRQPHAPAPRRADLAEGAAFRRGGVAQEGDRADTGPREGSRGRENGSSISAAGPINSSPTIRNRSPARNWIRLRPNNPVALQESYYQVFLNSRALKAFGIEPGVPDPMDFVKGSIMRDAAGKPTGIIKGDIAATRPVAARLPKVAPNQLEASSQALVADMNRAGLTSFGVAGCNADVLEIFQKWKAQGHLNVRTFCIGGAAASTPEQADRSIQQIAQMKLFQGDDYIDNVFFGESVYQPLHDPMFALKSSPPADQLEQWRRMAMAIAKAGLPLHVHAELHRHDRRVPRPDRSRQQGTLRSRTCAGPLPTSTRSTLASSSA